ncbi:MAG: hypothetical protein WB460_15105 [Candidatus Acidiferrales bacterium]
MASRPRTNVPITGAKPENRPAPNVLTNAADTSRDAEKLISRPPSPFANPYGVVNVPAPSNDNFRRYQTAGLPAKERYGTPRGGYNVTDASVHSSTRTTKDEMAAVGYGENDTRSDNSIISGYPIPGAARRTGPDGQPNARRRK